MRGGANIRMPILYTTPRGLTTKLKPSRGRFGGGVNRARRGRGAGGLSENESCMFLEHGADLQEKIGLEEGIVCAAAGPGAEEAGFVAVAEPVGDLLDDGLLQVVGECGL